MICINSQLQRAYTFQALGIQARSMRDQMKHHLGVTRLNCAMQGRVPCIVDQIDLSPMIEQELHTLNPPLEGGPVERGPPILISTIHLCALREAILDAMDVVQARRPVEGVAQAEGVEEMEVPAVVGEGERRLPVFCQCILGIWGAIKQEFDRFQPAIGCGAVQRRPPAGIGATRVGSARQAELNHAHMPASRGHMNRRPTVRIPLIQAAPATRFR